MLVAVSVLAISLSLLVYYHPPSTWKGLLTAAPSSKSDHEPQNDGGRQPIPAEDVKERPENQTLKETSDNKTIDPPSSLSPQTTPKANPTAANGSAPIPTFSLDAHESSDEEDNLPPPSFPAVNSAQRASKAPTSSSLMGPPLPKPGLMAPPPKPATTTQLMPPPPRIVPSNLRSLPTASPSLRVPTTGPLPNRGPPTSNGSLSPQVNGKPIVKTPNARGKVLLSPGHSPLDWANLQKSDTNLSGVSRLERVTPSQLKSMNGRKGKPAWSSYQGKVYNITPYLPFHPGGEGELRRAAGKDGGKLFMEVHPWVNWENMLGECLVGITVSEEEEARSSLEDMD